MVLLYKSELPPEIKIKTEGDYRKETDIGYDILIRNEISRSSMFAAFKRKIVRDDPELSIIFADAFK